MTQEDKNLLLKDLSARVPYGVKVEITAHNPDYKEDFGKIVIADAFGITIVKDDDCNSHPCIITCYDTYKTQGNGIEAIKPYLRPMSSMTEEESKQASQISRTKCFSSVAGWYRWTSINDKFADWLNSHHFDYRGLIPKGLALEAPKDMYTF